MLTYHAMQHLTALKTAAKSLGATQLHAGCILCYRCTNYVFYHACIHATLPLPHAHAGAIGGEGGAAVSVLLSSLLFCMPLHVISPLTLVCYCCPPALPQGDQPAPEDEEDYEQGEEEEDDEDVDEDEEDAEDEDEVRSGRAWGAVAGAV